MSTYTFELNFWGNNYLLHLNKDTIIMGSPQVLLGNCPVDYQFFFNCIYLFCERGTERERELAWVGKGQKEREREYPKQAPHCQCRAPLRAWSHEPCNHDLTRDQEPDACDAWVAQSVEIPTLDFSLSYDLTVCGFEPCIGDCTNSV